MESWEQRPEEPGPAFEAFKIYLNLGPSRSYDAAYQQAHPERPAGSRAPGNWRAYARKWQWKERAAAFDARNNQVADAARVETIRQLSSEQTAVDWESGRIQRQTDHEQRMQQMSDKLLDRATEMMSYPLIRKASRTIGAEGETIHVFEPVHWNYGDVVNALKLAATLGCMANHMPTTRTWSKRAKDGEGFEGSGNVPEELFFEGDAEAAEKLPGATIPPMPLNPAAKPQLDAKALGRDTDADLIQPQRERPGGRRE